MIALQRLLILFLFAIHPLLAGNVQLGIDVLLTDKNLTKLKNKHIGLITNQTAVNASLTSTLDLLKKHCKDYQIVALFAPEHGFYGRDHAEVTGEEGQSFDGIPIYSLYGNTRRPTLEMLENVDLLIYDIQDIGSRSYTFITTLFYVMEEAAKQKIPVLVLDRPNPINGITIDGPMLDESLRSMVGYINVPYCHGMTIGELARFFNGEYEVGCNLEVIPMKGWLRTMSFQSTGQPWIPTSPHIPESNTPLYYPITGILGELGIVNIGVGYTLPFKVIGAPWINASKLANALNRARYPGISFSPFYYRPFYGKYKGENCQGVLISVHDSIKYKPVATQFLIMGTLRTLYPKEFLEQLNGNISRKDIFCKVFGNKKAWEYLTAKNNLTPTLRSLNELDRHSFYNKRKKYLIPDYSGVKE